MLPQTGDAALDEARADLMESDQRRAPPPQPVGAARETAVNLQNQHVADEVSDAARRQYLKLPEDGNAPRALESKQLAHVTAIVSIKNEELSSCGRAVTRTAAPAAVRHVH